LLEESEPVDTPLPLLVAPPVEKSGLVQDVASLEDHLRSDEPPVVTVDGDAVRETVGTAGAPAAHEKFAPFAWLL
jgi:hypothetical protein